MTQIKYKRILIITDVILFYHEVEKLILKKGLRDQYLIEFGYSPKNKIFASHFSDDESIQSYDMKRDIDLILENFDLVLSVHCRQIFPERLVSMVKCINIHPGLNPYNRGWYPQIFSIINGLPCGATIHEIDVDIDHGPVIAQKEVKIPMHFTSKDTYQLILKAEIELLDQYFEKILEANYSTYNVGEGNLNLKKDFINHCKLDLEHVDTLANHLNLLRALSHGDYLNAYFLNESNEKIYVTVNLTKD